jgi:hypothetical protein
MATTPGEGADKLGREGSPDDRIKRLEERLESLLTGKVELEIHDLSVAPRSKLRVACE